MSKYLDVSNVNTMNVRESYDGTRYLELGVRSCACTYFQHTVRWGKQASMIECPPCKGTGKLTVKRYEHGDRRTRAGRKRVTYSWSESTECKRCYGSGRTHDWTKPVTCEQCRGARVVPQNVCDTIPQSFVDSLPIRVYREGTHEQYSKEFWRLRYTNVYSCSDYGDHTRLTDEQLADKVRQSDCYKHVQATKLVFKSEHYSFKFAHHIGVLCSQGGYEVQAIFDDCLLVPIEETPKYHDRRKAEKMSVESIGA